MISPNGIQDNISENLYNLEVVFHEVRHLYQKGLVSSKDNYSYDSLLFAMESILQNSKANYYVDNYDIISYEVDAEAHSLIDTYQFLNQRKKSLGKFYLKDMIENFKGYIEDKKDIYREVMVNDEDDYLSLYDALPKVNMSDLYMYPILNTIYRFDGSKKTIDEIIKEFINIEKEFNTKRTKKNSQMYVLYLKVLKDYIEVYKRKNNKEIDIDKTTKEIVEDFIESKKHK